MVSIMEIMQLCRLCLVKEQVNIPIFEDQGDIRQICSKITACLPVKISKEDKLPKKICDGCLYKLELLYQFWNTTANAEKQLLSWIEQANMDVNMKPAGEPTSQSQPQEHTVKQEKIEPSESTNENADLSTDPQSYILQQQLSYQAEFPYKESQGSHADGGDASENSDEPLSKRRRRRQASKPLPPELLDSSDNEAADSFLEMTVTKTEEESESDGDENVDDPDPAKFVPIGTEDSEQPGPSGLGKGGTEAPCIEEEDVDDREVVLDSMIHCSACSKTYKTIRHYNNHILHHKTVSCELCGKVYQSSFSLRRHQKAVHEKHASYICEVCDKDFATKHTLVNHRVTHLRNYKYRCDDCDSGYTSLAALKTHQDVKHGGVRFLCLNCDKVFMDEYYYKKHLLSHEPDYVKKEYICPICSKVLFYSNTYKNHMKIHNGRDYHICEVCGKALSTGQSLMEHMRLHTGEKPYVCELCGKSFANKKLIRLHKRSHTKEKPYMCRICNKTFTQKSTLTVHIRQHTGEKPYCCSICQKRFFTKTLLKTHSKSHGAPLK